jgi:acyl-CoA thioesterase FadM
MPGDSAATTPEGPEGVALGRRRIRRRWTNALGHLRARSYVAIFDEAAMAVLAGAGISDRTPRAGDTSPFLTDMHVTYQAELGAGEEVVLAGRVLGWSERRARLILVMTRARDGVRAATCELLLLNMGLAGRRPVPWSPAQSAIWQDLAERHRRLAPLAEAGRAIALAQETPAVRSPDPLSQPPTRKPIP